MVVLGGASNGAGASDGGIEVGSSVDDSDDAIDDHNNILIQQHKYINT